LTLLSDLDARFPNSSHVHAVSTHFLKHMQDGNLLTQHKERLRVETSDLARDIGAGLNTSNIEDDEEEIEQMLMSLESIQVQMSQI
jgi:hypothetical protein